MSLSDFAKKLKESYGEDISLGGDKETNVIPTGIFSLDMALGGGIPRGRMTLAFGAESSGKTTTCLKLMAEAQKFDWETGVYGNPTNPTPVAFIDLEAAFNEPWAITNGVNVDPDLCLVIRPGSAEQAGDIVNDLIRSQNVGAIIIDSLEAMEPQSTEEKSFEESEQMGQRAKLIARCYRKWTSSMVRRKEELKDKPWQFPALVAINQLREKIGLLYGNPNTLPGGKAQHFYSSVKISFNSAKVADDDQKTYGIGEFKGLIEKNKLAAPKRRFAFEMSLIASIGSPAGYVNNARSVVKYLKGAGAFVKGEKGGWIILGETYQKQDEFATRLEDPVFYRSVVEYIVSNGIEGEVDG